MNTLEERVKRYLEMEVKHGDKWHADDAQICIRQQKEIIDSLKAITELAVKGLKEIACLNVDSAYSAGTFARNTLSEIERLTISNIQEGKSLQQRISVRDRLITAQVEHIDTVNLHLESQKEEIERLKALIPYKKYEFSSEEGESHE